MGDGVRSHDCGATDTISWMTDYAAAVQKDSESKPVAWYRRQSAGTNSGRSARRRGSADSQAELRLRAVTRTEEGRRWPGAQGANRHHPERSHGQAQAFRHGRPPGSRLSSRAFCRSDAGGADDGIESVASKQLRAGRRWRCRRFVPELPDLPERALQSLSEYRARHDRGVPVRHDLTAEAFSEEASAVFLWS